MVPTMLELRQGLEGSAGRPIAGLNQHKETDLSQDWDMLQAPPGLKSPRDAQYKAAAAALWENAEPDAQRLLREAGIPPPDEDQEVPPAKQISRCMQEYKRVTWIHRTLIAKKVALQAKTEKIKKQFEAAVDQLTAVSSRIEEVEEQLMRSHAQVKEKVNSTQQPQITALSGLLKEAGIDLSKDQEGALDKLLTTNKIEVADLWKAEPGVFRRASRVGLVWVRPGPGLQKAPQHSPKP